jgi:hypothetical protein
MFSNRKIYWILAALTVGSYAWIGYHFLGDHSHNTGTLCLFKSVTGIPCPSCGITRSVLSLFQGDVLNALWINPLGILATLLLFGIPIWIISDLARNRYTLVNFYNKSEKFIQSQKFASVPLIVLIALNWIWNISKGL